MGASNRSADHRFDESPDDYFSASYTRACLRFTRHVQILENTKASLRRRFIQPQVCQLKLFQRRGSPQKRVANLWTDLQHIAVMR
jgi:hypothetical protein